MDFPGGLFPRCMLVCIHAIEYVLYGLMVLDVFQVQQT